MKHVKAIQRSIVKSLGLSLVSLTLLAGTACNSSKGTSFQQGKSKIKKVNSRDVFTENASPDIKARYAIEMEKVLKTSQEDLIRGAYQSIQDNIGDETIEIDGEEISNMESSMEFLVDVMEWSEGFSDITVGEMLEDLNVDISKLTDYDSAMIVHNDLLKTEDLTKGLDLPTDPSSLLEFLKPFEEEGSDDGASEIDEAGLELFTLQNPPVPKPTECGTFTQKKDASGSCKDVSPSDFFKGGQTGEAKRTAAYNKDLLDGDKGIKAQSAAMNHAIQSGYDWHKGQADMMAARYEGKDPALAQEWKKTALMFDIQAGIALANYSFGGSRLAATSLNTNKIEAVEMGLVKVTP